jgi:uncharacterized protein YndB with AHSA1/START domain
VEYFESEALINARASTVWEVITDAGNLTVWESGITAIDGELRNGGTIRIKTTDGGGRILRFRVQQMPGELMIWTRGLPFGLLKRIRTFTLSPQAGLTHLTVKEEVSGPPGDTPRKHPPGHCPDPEPTSAPSANAPISSTGAHRPPDRRARHDRGVPAASRVQLHMA